MTTLHVNYAGMKKFKIIKIQSMYTFFHLDCKASLLLNPLFIQVIKIQSHRPSPTGKHCDQQGPKVRGPHPVELQGCESDGFYSRDQVVLHWRRTLRQRDYPVGPFLIP